MDWAALLLPLVVPTALGLVGFGVLKTRVESAQLAIKNKADKEVVEVQYTTILARLDRIERGMERLMSR